MGAPIKEANAENPQDIPSLVPRRVRSGQMLGNVAAGKVTRPAERKPARINQLNALDLPGGKTKRKGIRQQDSPHKMLKAMREPSLFTAIHASAIIPETKAHDVHVSIVPK